VERLVLQTSRESPPRALPAEPEPRAAVLTSLLGWFPSAQRQAEVQVDEADLQLDEAELLRQVEQPSVPASLPAQSRAEPAAESPKAQAAWSAA